MKADGLLKHLLAAFAIALVLYFVAYTGIEHRRVRKGPWRVEFTNDVSGAPAIRINQAALAITNVVITFPGEPLSTHRPATLVFDQPQPVPFDVPFGRCLFMDTTFLPGTVVFELFGHEIQLIPRVLTLDKVERAWRSGTTIPLTPPAANSVAPANPSPEP